MDKKKKIHHLIIVGAGPAGLSASIYARRAGIDVLVLEKYTPGGQILTSEKIENYPGFPHPVSTQQLISRILQQAQNFGMELKNEEVQKIQGGEEKTIYTDSGSIYKSFSVIIATGAQPASLGVPGEEEFKGRGVSYCATCDAPFFKDEVVAVVGGGNTAAEEAIYLTRFASKIYLLHRRDRLRADRILQERILKNKKIDTLWSCVLDKIYGKERVEGVLIRNLKTGKTKNLPCSGVFIYVGTKPNSEFIKGWIETDEKGFILTNEKLQTNIPGVFACGDVRANLMKQVIVACSEGAQASFMAGKYLEEKGLI
ncbi:thioredoxin-disulfide reductase [Candidatus Aerophobetes bacterium]|uniref:Thioredoxin reductase n=1 Tax=Aerophobetes bacterium TaxID=2030807 RepID=A0A662DF45_UNCAE|nr:MAG: thioredoxin-disulfide reductase [Candidatus Aerophobetes bacterium]